VAPADPSVALERHGAGSRSTETERALWMAPYAFAGGLTALMLITPLGILAVGSAWGEWSPHDLANQALPAGVPQGLERLSSVWTALSLLLAAFCAVLRSAISFAAFGTGLILLARWRWTGSLRPGGGVGSVRPNRVIDGSIHGFLRFSNTPRIRRARGARPPAGLDPRVKLLGSGLIVRRPRPASWKSSGRLRPGLRFGGLLTRALRTL